MANSERLGWGIPVEDIANVTFIVERLYLACHQVLEKVDHVPGTHPDWMAGEWHRDIVEDWNGVLPKRITAPSPTP